jgi:hypothetical protein
MCRRSELVQLSREHLSIDRDGTGSVFLEAIKTDREAAGVYLALLPETMTCLLEWLDYAEITTGALFRSIPLIAKERALSSTPCSAAIRGRSRIARSLALSSAACARLAVTRPDSPATARVSVPRKISAPPRSVCS